MAGETNHDQDQSRPKKNCSTIHNLLCQLVYDLWCKISKLLPPAIIPAGTFLSAIFFSNDGRGQIVPWNQIFCFKAITRDNHNSLLLIVQRELVAPLEDRKLNLIIKNFEGIEEMTFGDSERLYQALRNLLTNAIKYTPDGGTITIDGRILTGFIEMTIADTGIGIDIADQERIFEKFGRVGNVALHSSGKIKFKGGGPGLGLPITKGIIEAHGGAIWVESEGYDEVNCPGTIFHVLLPIRKESPDQRAAEIFKPLADAGLNPPIMDELQEKKSRVRRFRRESW